MKIGVAVLAFLLVSVAVFVQADDASASVSNDAPKDIFSPEQLEQMKAKEETFEFQAEVNRLMDILINSLYKDREIFLRELISNAADALDKARFLALTEKNYLGEGEQSELDIRIKMDKEARTITITDRGVGMTKQDLVNNLGVVAKSGTTDFLRKASNEKDALSLIGQFGVGFYSVYLVADRVTVASKHNDDPVQHIWQSAAQSTFTITEDPRGNTLLRGTEITLHLKPDAVEFLDEARIETLVTRYSQFINFPIYLLETKEVEKEVPLDETEKAVDLDEKEEADVEEGEDEETEEPKTKTVKETVQEWKRLNTAKAIWTRSPKDVEEQEYKDFYKTLAKDDNAEYLKYTHFSAEGDVSFKALLFIPKTADPQLYDKFYEKSTALKLYVRRVLISDEFDNFLPRYLNFVKGVVDSDDLPLNVNRETLAQSKVLKVIGKKLTRKVLEMLSQMAGSGKAEKVTKVDEESDEEEKPAHDDSTYLSFWNEYSKSIKLGVLDDRSNSKKLLSLLRFPTSTSNGKFVSLASYVERMKDNQKFIYYITGESVAAVEQSPFLEQLKQRDLEVVYLVDPLDEYLTQSIPEFDGKKLMSIAKEGLKLPDDDKIKAREQKYKEEYKELIDWLKDVYGNKVEKVVVSSRASSNPCVLVSGQYGWSANMERIMKAQTLADPSKQAFMFPKKTLEINPRHPIIRELKSKIAEQPEEESLKDLANLMYESALLHSGFSLEDVPSFASRINRVVSLGLNVDPSTPLADEIEVEEPKAEEAEEEESEDIDESSVEDSGETSHKDEL